jgi:hypothetical protein
MSLSIKVTPILGSDIAPCMDEALKIAIVLDLHHVEMNFNGDTLCVYPEGCAVVIPPTGNLRRWVKINGAWELVSR